MYQACVPSQSDETTWKHHTLLLTSSNKNMSVIKLLVVHLNNLTAAYGKINLKKLDVKSVTDAMDSFHSSVIYLNEYCHLLDIVGTTLKRTFPDCLMHYFISLIWLFICRLPHAGWVCCCSVCVAIMKSSLLHANLSGCYRSSPVM